MQDEPTFKGEASEPGPDDLLTTQDIMAQYEISRSAVRQWRLKPAQEIRYGEKQNRTLRLYRRADVEAYAASQRRVNRLPKTKP